MSVMCVHLSVCVSFASDSSETIEVAITKPGTVTASDLRMHPVFFIFVIDLDLHFKVAYNILIMKVLNV